MRRDGFWALARDTWPLTAGIQVVTGSLVIIGIVWHAAPVGVLLILWAVFGVITPLLGLIGAWRLADRRLGVPEKNVMLVYPHPGLVRGEFMNRVLAITNSDDSLIAEVAELQTGPAMGMARNTLVRQFLASEWEWLWFLDTDMVISEGTLPTLLKHADPVERPIVGAQCVILSGQKVLVSMYVTSRSDDDGTFGFRHITQWPEDTMLRVDGTGAACLLVHRSVFGRITDAKPEEQGLWFTGMIIEGHEIGEDLSFCLRCALAGIAIYVHTGVKVGHMKTIQLGDVSP